MTRAQRIAVYARRHAQPLVDWSLALCALGLGGVAGFYSGFVFALIVFAVTPARG